ncbi:MAG: hypothetical protein K0U21_08670 [Proteobacteria bacterium]|nr:hypothetical protein [Pseudomonadota bacterium]
MKIKTINIVLPIIAIATSTSAISQEFVPYNQPSISNDVDIYVSPYEEDQHPTPKTWDLDDGPSVVATKENPEQATTAKAALAESYKPKSLDIHFIVGSSKIRSLEKHAIRGFIEKNKHYSAIGYASPEGPTLLNERLAMRRVNSVCNFIKKHGATCTVVGHQIGESASDRRVALTIDDQK